MKAICLKSDARTLEHRVWTRWLDEAARIAGRFNQELGGDDPFAYNETASVSHLVGAAARADYLALAEFATTKRAAHDRRRRAAGRSDFWMIADERAWAIEFKQITNGSITLRRIRSKMSEARQCARTIDTYDADVAVAGLIVPLFYLHPDSADAAVSRLAEFATECDFAWQIAGQQAEPHIYLFFDIIRASLTGPPPAIFD